MVSYSENLLEGGEGKNIEETEEWISFDDDEGNEETNDSDADYTLISLSNEEKIRIQKPWKRTLIIKLL